MKLDAKQENCKDLSIEAFTSLEVMTEIKDEWDSFLLEVKSDIYFTIDWMQTWWDYYGDKSEFVGYLVRDNGRIVAALPFSIDRFLLGILPFRLGRLVGAHSTISVMSPAISTGYEIRVLKIVLSHIFDEYGCNSVCFSPLSALSSLSVMDNNDLGNFPKASLYEICDVGPHTIFNLSENIDEYLTTLGKSRRRKQLYEERSLAKKFKISHRVISGSEALSYFEKFVEFHTSLWNSMGKLGHFGDWPKSFEFNRALIEKFHENRMVNFYEFSGDDAPLSMGYSFEFGKTSHNRLTARDPDPKYSKFGIGRVGYLKVLAALMEDGKEIEDSGPGHYKYKLTIGGSEHMLKRMVFCRPGIASKISTKLFLNWAKLIHFVYYRIWFLKLETRIFAQNRPLWKLWIRTRV